MSSNPSTEEEKAIQGDNSAQASPAQTFNPEEFNKLSPIEKLRELRKEAAEWREEKLKGGVPSNFNLTAEYMKDFGVGEGWEEIESRKATEEIRAFDAMPKGPSRNFEQIKHLISDWFVISEIQEDGTVIQWKKEESEVLNKDQAREIILERR